MKNKKLIIFLLGIIFLSSLSFIVLKRTNILDKFFNKEKIEYDENGLEIIKPGEEIENLIKNGDFQQGLTREWKVFPLEKKDSIVIETITKLPEQKYNVYTYVNDSSLKVETKEEGIGFEQELKFEKKDIPHFLQANVLIFSGEIKLVVLDKNNQELISTTAKAQENISENLSEEELRDYWQRLPVKIEDPKQTSKLIITSTLPNTKYYLTNIVLHPYQNYSEIFKGFSEFSARDYLKDCIDIKDSENYIKCVEEKTGVLINQVDEFFKMEIQHWGEVDENREKNKVLGEVFGIKSFPVSNILFATDFSDRLKNETVKLIRDAWKEEGVSKEMDVSNTKIESFDPLIPTSCSISGRGGSIIYFPEIWCEDPNFIFTYVRMRGWDGFYSPGRNRIFVDSRGDWEVMIKRVTKHEIGHLFGAPDSDFVEIKGNDLFPEGNSKEGTEWDDIMYSPSVGSYLGNKYSVGTINNVHDSFWQFQVNELFVTDEFGKKLSGKYNIFYGTKGCAHFPGYIEEFSSKIGDFSEGLIPIFPLLDSSRNYVAAFILVISEGKYYKGNFDLIDASVPLFDGQSKLTVQLKEFPFSRVSMLNPVDGQTINGINDIRVSVEPLDNFLPLIKWEISLEHGGEIYILEEGMDELFSKQFFVFNTPDYFVNRFGDFEVNLKISATFGNSISQVEVSDSSEKIIFHHPYKPEINEVDIDSSGGGNIYGAGFGQDEEKFKVCIKEIDRCINGDLLYNKKVLDFRAICSFGFNNCQFVPEDSLNKPLHFKVIRNGVESEWFLYEPASLGGRAAIDNWLSYKKQDSNIFYDLGERIIRPFFFNCLDNVNEVIWGIDTTDNKLGSSFYRMGSCEVGKEIDSKIAITSNEAENILNSSSGDSNFYWFICGVFDDVGNVKYLEQPEEIVSILNLQRGNNKFYRCAFNNLNLERRGDSPSLSTPTFTPTPTPILRSFCQDRNTLVDTNGKETVCPKGCEDVDELPADGIYERARCIGFGSCGDCNTCLSADKSLCRTVYQEGVCQENGLSAPCCLMDQSCKSGFQYACGYGDPKIYCNKCLRFNNIENDPSANTGPEAWCTKWDLGCGSGAPAKPRIKSPPDGFMVIKDKPINLSWYSYGEGYKEKCGEKLPGSYPKWENCNGTWSFDSTAQCLPQYEGGYSSDRDCWGYVCAKGSFGIPTDWRYYEVYVKKPNEEDFSPICRITDIPNPAKPNLGWIQNIADEKTNCQFIPDKTGEYQWYVRAGYRLTTQGGDYQQQNDSQIAKFHIGNPNLKATCTLQSNGNAKVTLSWDPVTNAASYAVRIDNKQNGWNGTCGKEEFSKGDICIDKIWGTAHTQKVEKNQKYSWWINPITADNVWGESLNGEDFICEESTLETPTPIEEETPTKTPTETPTETPAQPPSPLGQCETCRIFSAEPATIWQEPTPPVKKGQKLFLTTKGKLENSQNQTENLKARFRINNTANSDWCTGEGLSLSTLSDNSKWCETTLKQTLGLDTYFYLPYTFTNPGKYTIQAMLFNLEVGWY